ncbi:hypothetical protein [Limosilactobacillus urinaemulieris]|nr:hypothetical protein [Limosilactobacillus urinaemulieris]
MLPRTLGGSYGHGKARFGNAAVKHPTQKTSNTNYNVAGLLSF